MDVGTVILKREGPPITHSFLDQPVPTPAGGQGRWVVEATA